MPKVGDVQYFMRACGQELPQEVQQTTSSQTLLYWNLCKEEFEELRKAMNVLDAARMEEKKLVAGEIAEVADAIGDLIWVAIGLGISLGLPLHGIWDEIAKSNFLKINPQTGRVEKRADGKVMKPVGWKPPQIAALIERKIILANKMKGEGDYHG